MGLEYFTYIWFKGLPGKVFMVEPRWFLTENIIACFAADQWKHHCHHQANRNCATAKIPDFQQWISPRGPALVVVSGMGMKSQGKKRGLLHKPWFGQLGSWRYPNSSELRKSPTFTWPKAVFRMSVTMDVWLSGSIHAEKPQRWFEDHFPNFVLTDDFGWWKPLAPFTNATFKSRW